MKSVIHNINILISVRAHFRNVHSSTSSSLDLVRFELSANSRLIKRNSFISVNEMNWNQNFIQILSFIGIYIGNFIAYFRPYRTHLENNSLAC